MSFEMGQCVSIVRVLVVIRLIIQYSVVKKCSGAGLNVGRVLPWSESLRKLSFVRKHGVKQLIHRYHDAKGIRNDKPFWGDEVEYAILKLDHLNKRASLSLRAPEVMEDLRLKELKAAAHANRNEEGCCWHPEYGAWMIEGTPLKPYQGLAMDLHRVESNMRLRRRRLLSVLLPNEIAPTMSNFPMLGVPGSCFTTPSTSPGGPIADSDCVSDDIISPHPRFPALTANIRARRGKKVDIRVPLFADDATPEFKNEHGSYKGLSLPRHIHMDAMAFGMGCCCLQLTFQSRDVTESRYIYDQLLVLSPIMLALSAATPIHRGRLADTDVRLDVISNAVDDRTPAEYGKVDDIVRRNSSSIPEMAGGGTIRQPKSRFSSSSRFIYSHKASVANEGSSSSSSSNSLQVVDGDRAHGGSSASKYKTTTMMIEGEDFNDLDVPLNDRALKLMVSENVDHTLARHISYLFSRDPLVLFEGRIEEVDDKNEIEHFENIQSTNWGTVRWKPPPPPRVGSNDPHIGWRTEFRALEVQLSDFENAAYTVDINMDRAGMRNAVNTQLFYFRKSVDPGSDNVYILMTVEEILTGRKRGDCDDGFPGLIPLVRSYLELIRADTKTIDLVDRYLEFISKRASGKLLTTASWIRKFVRSHPEYRNDSFITDQIAYDVVKTCQDIGEGRRECPELLGYEVIEPIVSHGGFDIPTILNSGVIRKDV